MNLKNIAN